MNIYERKIEKEAINLEGSRGHGIGWKKDIGNVAGRKAKGREVM